jgi:hypothetical protein
MGKHNIKDIIDSELIARTNNSKIRHEYGDLSSGNISRNTSGNIEFTTQYKITGVMYVTNKGITKAEGVDFIVAGDYTIEFIKAIDEVDLFVLVAYEFDKLSCINLGERPVIEYFTVDPIQGGAETLNFMFKIIPNNGVDIHWSILKDGDSTPILTGISNESVNESYTITLQESIDRAGDDIPFTFVVTFNMPDISIDEKLLASANYAISDVEAITGSINVHPKNITTAGSGTYVADATINLSQYTPNIFTWRYTKLDKDVISTVIASGTELNYTPGQVINSPSYPYNVTAGTQYSETFKLDIDEYSTGTFNTVATERFIVNVPADMGILKCGTIIEDVNCTDGVNNNRLDTEQEFIDRNIEDCLLLEVLENELDGNVLIYPPDPRDNPNLQSLYDVYMISKDLAPSGITIFDPQNNPITSQMYIEINGIQTNSWIYVYKGPAFCEGQDAAAAVKILIN